jgi:predicted nucleic acid-binding protein
LAAFDFDRAVKWARIDRPVSLSRRDDSDLPFLSAVHPGPGLLLDTCVYIDQLQGKLPSIADDLMDVRHVNHSTIGIAELMHPVGRLDPHDPRTPEAVSKIAAVIKLMRPHRLFGPDADISGRAALLGGILSRARAYEKDDRLRAMNDCILFLQAAKLGLTVLSRNVRDFDFLLQLMPAGRVLLYRRTPMEMA